MDEFLYVEILMYLIDNDTDKKLAKSFPEIWQSIRVLELSHLFVNDILNHFKRTVFHHDLLSPSLACQNTNHWWRLTQISIMTLVRSHNLALGEVPCACNSCGSVVLYSLGLQRGRYVVHEEVLRRSRKSVVCQVKHYWLCIQREIQSLDFHLTSKFVSLLTNDQKQVERELKSRHNVIVDVCCMFKEKLLCQ